jgi:hypothetical protein
MDLPNNFRKANPEGYRRRRKKFTADVYKVYVCLMGEEFGQAMVERWIHEVFEVLVKLAVLVEGRRREN